MQSTDTHLLAILSLIRHERAALVRNRARYSRLRFLLRSIRSGAAACYRAEFVAAVIGDLRAQVLNSI
jgi:hypothetical protein